MRNLILLRGVPASGKSTFIEDHKLKPYTLCADEIRILFQSPVMNVEGTMGISQKNDKKVWQLLYDMLEFRMEKGEFIVVDATHTSTKSFQKYRELAEKYRYRLYCVDFSDVPAEVAIERNSIRVKYKRVPNEVIERMSVQLVNQKIPSGIKVIKPEDFEKEFTYKPEDLSEWEAIHHIGDIHGCYTALMEFIGYQNGQIDGLNPKHLYIFTGDLLDRGIENAHVLEYILAIRNCPNAIFIEGNHEGHVWNWANDYEIKSRFFKENTMLELEAAGISKKSVREFYRKVRQMVYYTYGKKTVLVTHGGISKIPENLLYIQTEQIIRGVGTYEDNIDASFLAYIKSLKYWRQEGSIRLRMAESDLAPYYQIHGHRNIQKFPIQVNERCFNLEGQVEFGGYLRIVTLTKEGFLTKEIKNNVFKVKAKAKKEESVVVDNAEFLARLKANEHIVGKNFGAITSFNFKNSVFYNRSWDEMAREVTQARGLFINTETTEIVARSYDKFWNVNERECTQLEVLRDTLVFPVHTYIKENGFLGIVGYDSQSDTLVFCSKSTIDGQYARWVKEQFYNVAQTVKQQKLIKEFLRDNNCSLVFEVIEPINDPHIIEHSSPKLVLLDIVYRTPVYNKMSYYDLLSSATILGFETKTYCQQIWDWQEFTEWYKTVNDANNYYKFNGNHIEGFVVEDSKGFMTKVKLPYYSFWKYMRSIKDRVASNKEVNTDNLTTTLAHEFYNWLKKQDVAVLAEKNIITLRNEFYQNFKKSS